MKRKLSSPEPANAVDAGRASRCGFHLHMELIPRGQKRSCALLLPEDGAELFRGMQFRLASLVGRRISKPALQIRASSVFQHVEPELVRPVR